MYYWHDWDEHVRTLTARLRRAGEDGATMTELQTALSAVAGFHVDEQSVHKTKNLAQRALKTGPENIVCDRTLRPPRYILTAEPARTRPWYAVNLKYCRTLLLTMTAVARSMVRVTAPGTIDGREARMLHLSLRQLRERLDLLQEEREQADERRRTSAGTP